MVETQVTKKEIVREVLETYSDPKQRATFKELPDGTCQYQSDNGNRCAVGRFMTEEALKIHGKSTKNIETMSFRFGLNSLLKKEYQGYPLSFWVNLQKLHDEPSYWSEDGITEEGLAYVKHGIGVRV